MQETKELKAPLSEFTKCFITIKKETPVIILLNGEQVRMPSGKSAWKNMRAAKLAWGNGLRTALWHNARTTEDYWRKDPNNLYNQAKEFGWKNLTNALIEEGILEFKQ